MRLRGPGAVLAIAIIVVLAVGAAGADAGAVASPRVAAAGTPAACREVPSGSVHDLTPIKGRTPVLLVHGFSGLPSDFSRSRDGVASMVTTLEKVPGVATATFDYSNYALRWVTDQHIGPALAAAIVCLAKQSGHRVVIVGHSMGGLAVKYAQAQTVAGTDVASVIDRIVTIGTPYEGSQLLGIEGSAVAPALKTLLNGARDVCGGKTPQRPTRDVCDLLGAEATPAVRGLTPDSADLTALPPFDPHLIVHTDAGNISLVISLFGLEQSFSVGDILVSVGSATAGASKGESPVVVNCRSKVSDIAKVIDDSQCSHGQLLGNRRIIGDVTTQVREAVHDSGTLS